MNLRTAKKLAKRAMADMRLVHVETHGRTFVVQARPNFNCMRWYAFIVVSKASPYLAELIAEGRMPLADWLRKVRADAVAYRAS